MAIFPQTQISNRFTRSAKQMGFEPSPILAGKNTFTSANFYSFDERVKQKSPQG
jgi:hypothetical protein